MRSINPNLYPKDGYWFQDTDGSKHYANSWAAVIRKVNVYRKRRGAPVNAVADEVIAQACRRNPIICNENAGDSPYKAVSLKSKVLSWLVAIREKADRLVFIPGVENRAAICAACPHNVTLPENCSPCRAAIAELRRAIIGGRPVSPVSHCAVLGEDLPVSIHIDLPTVANDELPGHCWRKRQL